MKLGRFFLTLAGVVGAIALVEAVQADEKPRRNIEMGFYSSGVFHPIRASKDYDQARVNDLAERRKRSGETSADQQLDKQFRAYQQKHQRVELLSEKLDTLKAERDGLKETLQSDGAAKLTNLLGSREYGLEYVPLQRARDLTGKNFSAVNIVKRGAHKYVPAEYFFDHLAAEAGYDGDEELRQGIKRAVKDKRRISTLGTQIADLTDQLKRARGERRAKLAGKKAA